MDLAHRSIDGLSGHPGHRANRLIMFGCVPRNAKIHAWSFLARYAWVSWQSKNLTNCMSHSSSVVSIVSWILVGKMRGPAQKVGILPVDLRLFPIPVCSHRVLPGKLMDIPALGHKLRIFTLREPQFVTGGIINGIGRLKPVPPADLVNLLLW